MNSEWSREKRSKAAMQQRKVVRILEMREENRKELRAVVVV
jgi:hypothetical protein